MGGTYGAVDDFASHQQTTPLVDHEAQQQHDEGRYRSTSKSSAAFKDNRTEFDDSENTEGDGDSQTTVFQTFVHLVKGYIGPGMLSLPWAVSRLGTGCGFVMIISMSAWLSYNSWTVVRVKRYIEHQRNRVPDASAVEHNGQDPIQTSTKESPESITYPVLGKWSYGNMFETFVNASICTQQLAVCTVYVSFVGENLYALIKYSSLFEWGFWGSHAGVMTMTLPLYLMLGFIPSLKSMAPVTAVGTLLIVATLVIVGYVGAVQWPDRPVELPTFDWKSAPLGACAILFSYEGICLVLPVESSMKGPKFFKRTFSTSMALVALILACFGTLCVLAFGDVTNGSATAYLLHQYHDEPSLLWWVLLANAAVSVSVLLTYPLQLFPAIELLGPIFSRYWDTGRNSEADQGGENQSSSSSSSSSSSFVSSVSACLHRFSPKMTLPGDSPHLRIMVVLLTYTIAVVVPNVHSLISLAGALAGSSSALIIPPILELAWLYHLDGGNTKNNTTGSDDNSSTKQEGANDDNRKRHTPFEKRTSSTAPPTDTVRRAMPHSSKPVQTPSSTLLPKIKCWLLLIAGFTFMVLGTVVSLQNIIAIYTSGPEQTQGI